MVNQITAGESPPLVIVSPRLPVQCVKECLLLQNTPGEEKRQPGLFLHPQMSTILIATPVSPPI